LYCKLWGDPGILAQFTPDDAFFRTQFPSAPNNNIFGECHGDECGQSVDGAICRAYKYLCEWVDIFVLGKGEDAGLVVQIFAGDGLHMHGVRIFVDGRMTLRTCTHHIADTTYCPSFQSSGFAGLTDFVSIPYHIEIGDSWRDATTTPFSYTTGGDKVFKLEIHDTYQPNNALVTNAEGLEVHLNTILTEGCTDVAPAGCDLLRGMCFDVSDSFVCHTADGSAEEGSIQCNAGYRSAPAPGSGGLRGVEHYDALPRRKSEPPQREQYRAPLAGAVSKEQACQLCDAIGSAAMYRQCVFEVYHFSSPEFLASLSPRNVLSTSNYRSAGATDLGAFASPSALAATFLAADQADALRTTLDGSPVHSQEVFLRSANRKCAFPDAYVAGSHTLYVDE